MMGARIRASKSLPWIWKRNESEINHAKVANPIAYICLGLNKSHYFLLIFIITIIIIVVLNNCMKKKFSRPNDIKKINVTFILQNIGPWACL